VTISNNGYDLPDIVPLRGVVDGVNAAAGLVGEVIMSTVLAASAVSLATGTAANVTSIALTPGDWMVSGSVAFALGGTTTVQYQTGAVNSVSATMPTYDRGVSNLVEHGTTINTSTPTVADITPIHVNIAAGQTWYLIARSGFGASAMTAYGTIRAQRIR
jgi:hypothetical protein